MQEIWPILQAACAKCHGRTKTPGQLRLASKWFALAGGVFGPVIVPADSQRSPLLHRLLAQDPGERMPQKAGPLPRATIAFPPRTGRRTFLPNNKAEVGWRPSQGEDRYRRGLSTFWRRTAPYLAFALLDAPSREVTTVSRAPTNTPLQALVLLNDPAFVEAARALGQRMVCEAPAEPRARAAYGFRLCVARPPNPPELEALVEAFSRERAHYARRPDQARALLGQTAPPGDPGELAAWTVVANVLPNLDETVTRE